MSNDDWMEKYAMPPETMLAIAEATGITDALGMVREDFAKKWPRVAAHLEILKGYVRRRSYGPTDVDLIDAALDALRQLPSVEHMRLILVAWRIAQRAEAMNIERKLIYTATTDPNPKEPDDPEAAHPFLPPELKRAWELAQYEIAMRYESCGISDMAEDYTTYLKEVLTAYATSETPLLGAQHGRGLGAYNTSDGATRLDDFWYRSVAMLHDEGAGATPFRIDLIFEPMVVHELRMTYDIRVVPNPSMTGPCLYNARCRKGEERAFWGEEAFSRMGALVNFALAYRHHVVPEGHRRVTHDDLGLEEPK